MNKKWKKLACLMFFFLLFEMPCAADDLDTLPVEEAVRAARHVMIGMIGYSEQEADALRYEGYHLEGNITTTVEVYPAQTTDDPFILHFLSDGSMMKNTLTAPHSGYTIEERRISAQEAVDLARHLLIGLYGYADEVVGGFDYTTREKEDIGLIAVYVRPFDDIDEHFTIEYWTEGRLMSLVVPDILDFDGYVEYVHETGRPFQWFTHEERATYSQAYRPKVEAALRLNPLCYEAKYHFPFTRHIYGVPDESDITEKQALELARAVLIDRFSCDEDSAKDLGIEVYFDCCDPQRKLWKFCLFYRDGERFQRFIVHLESRTGELVDCYPLDPDSVDERY